MEFGITILAALVGYLSGSISFAWVISQIFAPGQKIGKIRVSVPDSDAVIESDTISATTVRMALGPRYGCLTSVLDMLKAALPALLFKLWQPDVPYYLIAAGMATVGHNWPIYHRFNGGRGLSPILGGFLVLDWLGVIVTNLIAALIGMPVKNMLLVTGLGIVLMIPWIWIRDWGWIELIYVVAMNILFWTAMIPELKEYLRLQREGSLEAFRDAQRLEVLKEDGSITYDEVTITNLANRIRARMSRKDPGD